MAGRLLVVSGPSGSGKSSIVNELIERLGIEFSVSATTRLPRPGERHGVHYNFISRREFETMIELDELLEWAIYNNRYYGTPASFIEETLADQTGHPARDRDSGSPPGPGAQTGCSHVLHRPAQPRRAGEEAAAPG